MRPPLLEACVDSHASALAAWENGADRLELCANLAAGGTTPSPVLFRQIRRFCRLPIHVLIRPRPGDFLYSQTELEQMAGELELFRDLGADGFVFGVLTPKGELDVWAMGRLMACARGMPVTLHRAFDMARDPMEAVEAAVQLGCKTILTSGQAPSALAGTTVLRAARSKAAGRIDIMAGGGVSGENVEKIFNKTGIRTFHASCRKSVDSEMAYRREGIFMGVPGLPEYQIWQTDGEALRACAGAVHRLPEP